MIVAYDPRWFAEFQDERRRIAGVLGALAIRIEHNGSTAVPGLAAKPIIDIQVSVASLEPIDAYRIPLAQLGYVHLAHADDGFSPFFHRPAAWPHSHHVHVVVSGGVEERRTLAFRDYLRDHESVARQYEQLKRALVDRFSFDDADAREHYAQAKSAFIEGIVARALAEGY